MSGDRPDSCLTGLEVCCPSVERGAVDFRVWVASLGCQPDACHPAYGRPRTVTLTLRRAFMDAGSESGQIRHIPVR